MHSFHKTHTRLHTPKGAELHCLQGCNFHKLVITQTNSWTKDKKDWQIDGDVSTVGFQSTSLISKPLLFKMKLAYIQP